MKKHRVLSISGIIYLLAAALLAAVGVMFFRDRNLFYIELAVSGVLVVLAVYRLLHMQHDIRYYLHKISRSMDSADSAALQNLAMPILIAKKDNEIIWYNDSFREHVLLGGDIYGASLQTLLPPEALSSLDTDGRIGFEQKSRHYVVYKSRAYNAERDIQVLYFHDDTKLWRTAEEYSESRPTVAIIALDNIDELLSNIKDSEKAAITGEIEHLIEDWVARSTGMLRKLDRDHFLFVLEERHLQSYITDRFDILEQVRSKTFGDKKGATLSIGIGRGGKTLRECEEGARQALDMALGRGGDQAAIKTNNNFEFYGGVSKGFERRTKVRTRVIASALRELIQGSDNIFIMGHRFGDLDSFGSSLGIWSVARRYNRASHIVADTSKSLAKPLIARMDKAMQDEAIISGEQAEAILTRKSLLIIVDTHRADFLDYPALYSKCKTVVVIDHHRKTVDHIDNAVIFYHESYSSSASEMVAELIQYIDADAIGRLEAEALLSGIMLDTRNFVLKTGVRTFEAASFLRSKGADPVEVKRLFASSMPSYKTRSAIVAAAELYNGCAISFTEAGEEDVRVVASQAADELLTISGVNASFVMYPRGEGVNISARSLGEVNVQIIMETLGGGGHLTMAAAQLADGTGMEEARARLCEAIDQYFESN